MKNPLNSVPIYIPKVELVDTSYPVPVVNEFGAEEITHVTMSDSEISNIPCSDFSLRSLINAGVDPSRIGKINTSSYNRIDEVSKASDVLSSVEFPDINAPSDNSVESPQNESIAN